MNLNAVIKKSQSWKVLSKPAIPAAGVFVGVLVGSSLVVPKGGNLFNVLGQLVYGAFGTVDNFSESLIYAIPLGLTGLAVAFSYSAGIFNIGCEGQLKDPAGVFPHSRPVAATARLGFLIAGSNLHSGLWLFLVMVLVVYCLLFKTTFGFRVRGVGFNLDGARYAGINIKRIMVSAMMISGALAGIAGSVEIMGVHYRLLEGFSPGYGFDAIAVALLVNLNPIGIIISSLFFGALRNAANSLQIDLGIPVAFVYIIQGLAILFVIGSHALPRVVRNIRRSL
ncbi:MAG: ABC transporter permease [Spirochaetota bacterium]